MNTKSVKSYSTPYIETMAEDGLTPRDIVCELEEAFQANFLKPAPYIRLVARKPLTEIIANDPVMGSMADEIAAFRERRRLAEAHWVQKSMLFATFGRYGLEKDEVALVAKSKDGLESIEDRLAAVCHAIEAIKSRKTWKIEQNKHQNPSNYADLDQAKKVKVGDRNQWVDARVYELPPITKGKAHEPAFYAMKLPDGRVVNLGASQGSYAPILNKYPSRALRNIATRLGITPVGGDTAVLNLILEAPQIEWVNDNGDVELCYKWLPSYTTAWQGNVWLVYVGWRLNPKCTPSRYWVDADGQLTQDDPNKGITPDHEAYQVPLTLSQLDYHLLSDSSDLAVANEEGEVVDYMNEEEEFLTFCPQREDEPDFIDFSKYCEDDEELELLNAAASVIERSEGGLTMGDLQSKAFTDDYLHDGIESAKQTIARCMKQEPSELSEQIIGWMQEKIARLCRLTDLHNAFVTEDSTNQLVRYWYPHTHGMWTMGRNFDSYKEPVKTQDCMLVTPLNEIEQPKLTRHEFKPWPSRSFQMTLGQSKQLRRQKQVVQAIINNRFGTLIREKAVAQTFESTLDSLLGLRP